MKACTARQLYQIKGLLEAGLIASHALCIQLLLLLNFSIQELVQWPLEVLQVVQESKEPQNEFSVLIFCEGPLGIFQLGHVPFGQ